MWLPRPLQLMLYLLLSTSYSLGVNSNCNICWPLGNTIIKSNTSLKSLHLVPQQLPISNH